MRSEFDFIHNLKSKYSLSRVGDDCAVLSKDAKYDLLLTTDMLIEDIDFRLAWITPELLGHKALAVSLSDIAAMGGKPVWSMLSIGVPETLWQSDFIDRFYEGWFTLARNHGVELIGGDVSRSEAKLVVDSIVGGEVAKGKAILRSTANIGDAIFVSGTLGGAAGGLKLLENGARCGQKHNELLILKQLQPQPQLSIAKLLYQLDIATSMIDISDGLSSDLAHLCEQSMVGANVKAERIPVNQNLLEKFPADECLRLALDGGEDFELLFTADREHILKLESIGVTHIGETTAHSGVMEIKIDKVNHPLTPNGFSHFDQ